MRRTFASLTILAVVCWASMGSAQTAIKGATVHPIDGQKIDEGVVVIDANGEIEAVGDSSTEIPADAEIVDAEGKVVTPGLIDARTHLGVVEIWATDRTRDHNRGGKSPIRAAFRAADGFNPTSVALPVTRTGGVTSALVVPGGGVVAGQSAWIDLGDSEIGYGSVVSESTAMHLDYGARHGKKGLASRGAVLEKLRELYDDVVFYDGNTEAYDSNQARELTASRLDLRALGRTLEEGLPVAINAHRASDIRQMLEFADEHELDPVITGGVESWMIAEELADREVPVVVNPVMNLPTHFSTLGARTDTAAILAESGVPVIISTFGTHNVRKLRQLAGNAVRAGLSHQAALRAVTLNPARAFGMADKYGSLAAGKLANIVVWSGDPFELSTRVDRMYVHGEEVSLQSRQSELFERYRTLERRGEPASER